MKNEKYKLVFSCMAIIGKMYLVFFIFHFSFNNLSYYEYRRT